MSHNTPQAPPRKNEDELLEEEEFQLALALSQSEAEAKEKEKFKLTTSLHNTVKAERSPSPPEEKTNPELARYLNRSYWESLTQNDAYKDTTHASNPSAPITATAPAQSDSKPSKAKENGVVDADLEEFINTLKSQVEIFINRMKSNSSRGRCIANDTSVQTLFLNITAMHSQLLRYIQHHDDSRLHYERLQDKLTQVKDARAALDALREEHCDKLRREAEEAERLRQLQMAHKLEIMRKKKQEYLQYQRQLALQRIQEQEREMLMRQEQQKQQYLMGPQFGGFMGSPVHGQQFQAPPNSAPGYHAFPTFNAQPPLSAPAQFASAQQQNFQGQPTGNPTFIQGGGFHAPPPPPGFGGAASFHGHTQNSQGQINYSQPQRSQSQPMIVATPNLQFVQQQPQQSQQQVVGMKDQGHQNGEAETAELIKFD